jgi:ABC-type amino acid transport system permease subunit
MLTAFTLLLSTVVGVFIAVVALVTPVVVPFVCSVLVAAARNLLAWLIVLPIQFVVGLVLKKPKEIHTLPKKPE